MAIPIVHPVCTPSRMAITAGEYRALADAVTKMEKAYQAPMPADNWLVQLARDIDPEELVRHAYRYQDYTTIIDCATGRPWLPGPRKRPAPVAPVQDTDWLDRIGIPERLASDPIPVDNWPVRVEVKR